MKIRAIKKIRKQLFSGVSEAIKRAKRSVDVRVAFKPISTLQTHLVRVKDPTPSEKKFNVVYKIPCSVCLSVYIGQTGRLLETRVAEHKAAVKHAKCNKWAVAEHVWKEEHQMNFQGVSILAQEGNRRRCFMESWFIQTHNTMNHGIGSLLPMYSCLLYLFVCFILFYTFTLFMYISFSYCIPHFLPP